MHLNSIDVEFATINRWVRHLGLIVVMITTALFAWSWNGAKVLKGPKV